MNYRVFLDSKAVAADSVAGAPADALARLLARALRRVGGAVRAARAASRRRRLYRATTHDLSGLDDRVLKDIGLTRGDIRRVALDLAEASETLETEQDETGSQDAPRDAPTLVARRGPVACCG